MNQETISTDLTEMCAEGYEEFLRRERLWESAEREKIMGVTRAGPDELIRGNVQWRAALRRSRGRRDLDHLARLRLSL